MKPEDYEKQKAEEYFKSKFKPHELSESTETTCYALFAAYRPCVYYGEILCKDCEQHKRCDMEIGRTLHEKCYVDGFNKGLKA